MTFQVIRNIRLTLNNLINLNSSLQKFRQKIYNLLLKCHVEKWPLKEVFLALLIPLSMLNIMLHEIHVTIHILWQLPRIVLQHISLLEGDRLFIKGLPLCKRILISNWFTNPSIWTYYSHDNLKIIFGTFKEITSNVVFFHCLKSLLLLSLSLVMALPLNSLFAQIHFICILCWLLWETCLNILYSFQLNILQAL